MGAWSDFIARFRKPASPQDDPGSFVELNGGGRPPPPVRSESWLARWRPGSKRDRQIAWLQAGYQEMLDLMRGIRQHLDRQEDVQHKVARALELLPGSLESLKDVGRAAEQQVEVLGLLRQQIEAGVQHDAQLVESMNRFNETLGVLDETSRTSGRTVVDLVEKSKESENLLRDVIRRSQRSFMLMSFTFIAAVFLGIAAAVYFIVVNPQALQRLTRSAGHPAGGITTGLVEPGWPEPKLSPAADLDETAIPPGVPAATEPPVKRGGFFHKRFHPRAPAVSETPAVSTEGP
jgi:hypothetical protein